MKGVVILQTTRKIRKNGESFLCYLCWMLAAMLLYSQLLQASWLPNVHGIALTPYQPACMMTMMTLERVTLDAEKDTRDTNLVLETNSGVDITEIIAHYKTAEYESVVAFSRTGEKLFDIVSNMPDRVHITTREVTKFQECDGYILIHNHIESEHGLSGNDIQAFIKCRIPLGLVANGKYLYVVNGAARDCPEEELEAYAQEVKTFYETRKMLTALNPPATVEGLDVVSHAAMLATAEEFGFEYGCLRLN